MSTYFQKIPSPVGELYAVASGKSLCALVFKSNWDSFKERFDGLVEKDVPILRRTRKQLSEYFQGKRRKFEIPYVLQGTTFQQRVWRSLSTIPFGETRSYKEQAVIVKSPKAARAIGRADGLNPICIILPCHRVLGSDGSLTGFAGGLGVKRFLLKLEDSKFI